MDLTIPSPLVVSSASEWMKEKLTQRMDQYSAPRALKILIGSWNVNGKIPEESFHEWLLLKEAPDLIILGFQEMDLSTDSYITGARGSSIASLWCRLIEDSLKSLYPDTVYSKLNWKLLMGLFIIVYAKEDLIPHIHVRQNDSVGCGILGLLGNKGAVALRFDVDGQYFVFVNSHLAAHANQNSRRNQDYAEICRRLNFASTVSSPVNPYSAVGGHLANVQHESLAKEKENPATQESSLSFPRPSSSFLPSSPSSSSSPSSTTVVDSPPLSGIVSAPVGHGRTSHDEQKEHPSKRNGKSVFHSNSSSSSSSSQSSVSNETTIGIFDAHFLFWMGDLNYRVSLPAHVEGHDDMDGWKWYDQGRCAELLTFDQLTAVRAQGLAFQYFTEGPIDFAPTYKFIPGSSNLNRVDRKRFPSWCDRVLWRQGDAVVLQTYTSCPSVILSDHKPVLAAFEASVRLVQPEQFQEARRQVLKELDFVENQGKPSVQFQSHVIELKGCKLGQSSSVPWMISNDGNVPLTYRFTSLPGQLGPFPPWLMIEPLTASLGVGESLTLTAHFCLNVRTCSSSLESVAIFHLVQGRDQFISISVALEPSFYGLPLSQLDYVLPGEQALGTDSPDSLGISIANANVMPCEVLKFDAMDPMPQVELPFFLYRLFEYLIVVDQLESKNIFLSSGQVEMVQHVRDCLDTHQLVCLSPTSGEEDKSLFAQSVAEIILDWLSTLPTPLLEGLSGSQVSSTEEICRSLYSIPQLNAQIFVSLCWFLRQVLISQSSFEDFTARVTKLCLTFSLVLFSADAKRDPSLPQFVEYSILGNISNMMKFSLR